MAETYTQAMIPARIQGVGFDPQGENLMVILEAETGRILPVVIGALETQNIMIHLSGEKPPRPLMPDLFLNTLELMGAKVTQLHIYELRGGTYYGRLLLEQRGLEYEMDCRPSDGLALAIRAEVPILISKQVLEEGGVDASRLQEMSPKGKTPQA
ncbi:MAG: bifunctional nuclease family protein [Meiothermus sp.]|nr:bifunctional nuclease family protein [Meiothermus sp.]